LCSPMKCRIPARTDANIPRNEVIPPKRDSHFFRSEPLTPGSFRRRAKTADATKLTRAKPSKNAYILTVLFEKSSCFRRCEEKENQYYYWNTESRARFRTTYDIVDVTQQVHCKECDSKTVPQSLPDQSPKAEAAQAADTVARRMIAHGPILVKASSARGLRRHMD
jgi:hypothetical protein